MNQAGAVTLGKAGVAPPESTVGRVDHPVLLDGGVLIDDAVADRLQRGDPTVGWEGDPRLALYLHRGRRQWELWRLEVDGRYRPSVTLSTEGRRGIDAVGELLVWLVTHDGRRGYKVINAAMVSHDRTEADRAYSNDQHSAESAERLAHALIVDGVQPRDFWAVAPNPKRKKGRRA